jgi:hypothetical protein
MRDGRHARRIVRELWPRFGGALLTVCAAALLELISRTALRVPNPAAILVLTTVFSAFSGGLRPGLISAAVSWLYLAYFLDEPGPGLAYAGDNVRRLVVWVVSLPAIVDPEAPGGVRIRRDRASRTGPIDRPGSGTGRPATLRGVAARTVRSQPRRNVPLAPRRAGAGVQHRLRTPPGLPVSG